MDGQHRGRGQRHVTAARILVIDGNVAEIRARQEAALGYDSGVGYSRVLRRMDASLRIDIVLAADGAAEFPAGVGLDDYDGVTMTGSALNIYNGGPPVTRQIDLAKAVFAAGVPFFGSCWGLQVAVTAAGGEVHANPQGREFGFARRILLTDAGREHPLFAGKPAVFEAPTVHRDSIAVLPGGAAILARNDFGVQATAFTFGRGTFWGVQYHPEYDYVGCSRRGRALRRHPRLRRHLPRPSGARCIRRASFAPCRQTRRIRHCSGNTRWVPRCRPRRCVFSRSATGCGLRCCLVGGRRSQGS